MTLASSTVNLVPSMKLEKYASQKARFSNSFDGGFGNSRKLSAAKRAWRVPNRVMRSGS